MSDLVERLRRQNSYHEDGPPFHVHDPVCSEAADEIERLHAQIGAMREALEVARGWMPEKPIAEDAKADCDLVDAAIKSSSPIADAMLAVIEALRQRPPHLDICVCPLCSALASLDHAKAGK